MAGLPDLVVGLAANTSKYSKGLNDAKGMTKGFASSVTGLLNPVKVGFAALAGGVASVGVGVYALTGRIGKLAGVADEAVKTGLSGAFIQQLGYAADQSGVSVETLTGGIKKLTIAVGQGSKGFKEIGLNLADLQRLSPEEQFRAVAAKIAEIPTAAGRAAAAMKVFGKSGFDMAGLFSEGMTGVNKLLADAKDLGIGLSDEALAKAAAADDSIQRMYASFGALFDQMAVGVAPVFDEIATAIGDWIPPLTSFMDKFNELPDKAKFVGDVFEASMDVAIETIKDKWTAMLADMLKASAGFAVDSMAVLGMPGGMARMGANVGGGFERAGNLKAAEDRLAGLIEKLNKPAEAKPENFNQFVGPREQGFADAILRNLNQKQNKGKGFGIVDSLKEPIAAAQMGIQGIIDRAKIKGNAALGTLGNWLGGKPEEKTKQIEPRLAGAMQRGSAEAYSTLAQAFINRGKDPVVKATETQTKQLVAAINAKPPVVFNVIGDLLAGVGL
jgi:hypothetical protein